MATNKIGKDAVLQLINEEAFIITRKVELYEEIKKIEEELKKLNECMGLAGKGITGTFGFAGPSDVAAKANVTGFVNPMSISHIEQLAKDMGMENPYDAKNEKGFGDEYDSTTTSDSLEKENELLRKELNDLKMSLGK